MIYEPAPYANHLTRELIVRLHNEPICADLGPCECPVCRPDEMPKCPVCLYRHYVDTGEPCEEGDET